MGEITWFDIDIVQIVIFIEVRFLIPKFVISCLKKTLKKRKKSSLALNLIKLPWGEVIYRTV